MKPQRLLLACVFGLGLALALLILLNGLARPAQADPAILCVAPGGIGCAVPCSGACYASVQSAVDAAAPGDEIRVAAGVYTGVQARNSVTQVVYITKTVTVRGGYATRNWNTSYPLTQPTTLDAQGQGRVVFVAGMMSPTLEGITLQRGNAAGLGGDVCDAGGAVYVIIADPVITNCRILSSTACFGGGLAIYKSTAIVANSVVSGNVAIQSVGGITRGVGGGMLLYQSAGVVAGNLVANNVASGTWTYEGGGGLYLDGSTTLIRGNTIQNNRGPHSGGGMVIYGSTAIVRGNTILNNTGGIGGGVYLVSSPANFEANTVIGNGSTAMGGGFAILDSIGFTLTNNVVAQNYGAFPAGLIAWGSTPGLFSQGVLIHNTFADNPSAPNPWTICLGYPTGLTATLVFTNNIIGAPAGILVDTGSVAVLNTTLWDKIPIGAEWFGTGTFISSTNLYGNAEFVGQYRISPRSPAIDQGTNAGVATDIDGEPRPNGPKPDIGADEFYCYALTGVSLAGPTTGISGTACSFTAIVSPATTTPLITYTWQATGQPLTSHVVYSLSDSALFAWAVTGTQTVSVTAVNCGGSATTTHAITIVKWRIYLPIVLRN